MRTLLGWVVVVLLAASGTGVGQQANHLTTNQQLNNTDVGDFENETSSTTIATFHNQNDPTSEVYTGGQTETSPFSSTPNTSTLTSSTTENPCYGVTPGKVSGVNITSHIDSHLITWKPPTTSCQPTSYNVTIERNRTSEMRVTTDPQINLIRNADCEKIQVKIQALGVADNGRFSVNKKLHTWEGVPGAVNNIQVYSTKSTAYVAFNKPEVNKNCVVNYEVNVKDSQGNISASVITYVTSADLTSLQPCTNYTLNITSVGHDEAQGKSAFKKFQTSFADPGAVSNIKVNASNTSAHVTFNKPEVNKNCIVNYEVNVKDSQGNISASVLTYVTSADLTSLQPCTNYTLNITSVGHEEAQGKSAFEEFQTSFADPGAVSNIKVNASNTSAHVAFDQPKDNPNCVVNYEVNVKDSQGNISASVITYVTSADLTSLQPCTNYTLNITSVGHEEAQGKSAFEEFQTSFAEFGAPRNLQIRATGPHSISVNWSRPSKASSCVRGYQVKISPGNFVMAEMSVGLSYQSNKLAACTKYLVNVTAISNSGHYNQTVTSQEIETGSEVSAPPNNGEVQMSESRGVTLRWHIPKDDRNNCNNKELVVTCCKTENCDENPINTTVSISNAVPRKISLAIIDRLEPYTDYTCFATINNAAGFSKKSESLNFKTKEEMPPPPNGVTISEVMSRNFTVTWLPPNEMVGDITGYTVTVTCTRVDKPGCDESNSKCPEDTRRITVEPEIMFLTVHTTPDTTFGVYVSAHTSVGEGNPSDEKMVITRPEAAGPVKNLQSQIINSTSCHIFWEEPCKLFGNLSHYQLQIRGSRPGYPVYNKETNQTVTEVILNDLPAEFEFLATLEAKVQRVTEQGQKENTSFKTGAIAPALPNPGEENNLKPNPELTGDPSTQVHLTLKKNLFNEKNGKLMYWALLVAKFGNEEPLNSADLDPETNWPLVSTWGGSNKGLNTFYQATDKLWNPFTAEESKTFLLGSNETCLLVGKEEFCNGPLEPDTLYWVKVRAFTKGGYRDSRSEKFKTGTAPLSVGVILGCIAAVLMIGILTVTLFLLRRRGEGWTDKLRVFCRIPKTNLPSIPRVPPKIPVERFSDHCKSLMRSASGETGESKLTEEYRLLGSLGPQPLVTSSASLLCSAATLPANKYKNRYINILPFDATRVKISLIDEDPSSDYVNASFIKGYSGEIEYIASQGPKEETCEDFWRMVFEHQITILVMVTQLVEKDKEKCHQYYPNLRDSLTFGDVTVKSVGEVHFPIYTSRSVLIQKDNLQKTVTQLHFREWPDFGCPLTTDLMLDFCATLRQHVSVSKGLILVHCSAGVGRTGTLIATDILLQHISENKDVDIFGTVLKLRHQRINMVQTESQYKYIYQCIKESLEAAPAMHSDDSGMDALEPIYENLASSFQTEIASSEGDLTESKEVIMESCM